ncbi:MAG: hypothetical protein HYZ90_00155 [Candidatus Omnitrophica bacterium]|nr:hypothetical protein [Candidatus Omnitrophota bacterium]
MKTVLALALSLWVFADTGHWTLDTAFAAVKQEVYITGSVQSFPGYTFTQAVRFLATEPGEKEIGVILVEGVYNGGYPWIMRAYTDNLHFAGVGGALRRNSPAGLVSKDGQFNLPLEINCPSFGEGVWRRVPDLSEPDYAAYRPSPEPTQVFPYADCVLMGIDPRNAPWVVGPDGLLFTEDDNLLGDITVETPFELKLRTHVSRSSVQATYEGVLYIEIIPAP